MQYNDGGPAFAFDGNLGSAWHTQYVENAGGTGGTYEELPQSIEFGLGGEQLVGKLGFEGKTPVGHNGFLKRRRSVCKIRRRRMGESQRLLI